MSSRRIFLAQEIVLLLLLLLSSFKGSHVTSKKISAQEKRAKKDAEEPNNAGKRMETFMDLVNRSGYLAEEHSVTTDDGYILTVHRMPASSSSTVCRPAVLLIHGLFAASDIWVLRGPKKDLAYLLVDEGYDVWAVNVRGNFYGKRHVLLSVEDPEFWRFSWHEFGAYDVAAVIDYILSETGLRQVSLIGHSMGGAAELVLLSSKPEYNKKVNVVLSFAPAVVFTHELPGLVNSIILFYGKQIEDTTRLLGMYEIFPRNTLTANYGYFCQRPRFLRLCEKLLYYLFGLTANGEQLFDRSLILPLLHHYPQGTSVETLLHYRQVAISGEFRPYDFGPDDNYHRYGKISPPEYPLENISVPIVIFYGENDPYTTEKDAMTIQSKLRTASLRRIRSTNFSHLDFIFSKESKNLVYDDVLEILRYYRDIVPKEKNKRYTHHPIESLQRFIQSRPIIMNHCSPKRKKAIIVERTNFIADSTTFFAVPSSSDSILMFPMKSSVSLSIIWAGWLIVLAIGQSALDMTLSGFVNDSGYPWEVHNVVTEDGYILSVHRIPHGTNETANARNNGTKPVVLLVHGLLGCSADWILTGPNRSLAFLLADDGYDVWMGNSRGTTNSKNHTHLPVTSSQFWDFSWHEMGVYDAPAVIDYILDLTGQKQLFYIGFSQGTTQFWILCSLRPEYNEKIKLMTALAPVAYAGHLQGMLKYSSYVAVFFKWLYRFTGFFEFMPNSYMMKSLGYYMCRRQAMTQPICELIEFSIAGFDDSEFDSELMGRYLLFSPAGCSFKQLVHYALSVTNPGHFRPYDNGWWGNFRTYGSLVPPEYPLGKVTAPIVLYNGLNDYLADPQDVDLLHARLPNVIERFTVTLKTLNHFDFIYGLDIPRIVYEDVLRHMNEYRDRQGSSNIIAEDG
ncbi:uncharacterized protein [Prorops nasuta]|uniref:uncharacterized protein n=1 Tax=Prorops nasuta TaxID=863751 RepID=UPI0034CF4CC7